jgi:hypothetical protein
MSETTAHPSVISLLDDIRALEALVAQYRDTHGDDARLWQGKGDCFCQLCDRAEGLGIAPVNWLLDAEDAVAELGRLA